ncbi:MAG: hypothetical protein ABS40_10620 [Agrobacterium sp. SCN 61-19]|nr:MAG: hypothetical protein ABS40_10620 [Agrobacterium sp. SCN 61-19]
MQATVLPIIDLGEIYAFRLTAAGKSSISNKITVRIDMEDSKAIVWPWCSAKRKGRMQDPAFRISFLKLSQINLLR